MAATRTVMVETTLVNGAPVLRVRGDVDLRTSPQLREALLAALQTSAGMLRVDLSQVRYMDSSGIATLVEGMQNCMKKGTRLRLFELSAPVRDVFELARLATVFEIFPTMRDAVTGL